MKPFSMLYAILLGLGLSSAPALAEICPESNPDTEYQNNGNGTVTHLPTGLIWKICLEGQSWSGNTCTGQGTNYNWSDALKVAAGSSFAGQSDWRVPNIRELESLLEDCGPFGGRVNQALGDARTWSETWSSSPSARDPSSAWTINFSTGGTSRGDITYSYLAVGLVRSGQSFTSFDRLAINANFAVDADKVFAWAEKNYPSVFAPAGFSSQTIAGYRYRSYLSGQTILAVTTGDIHELLYLGPLSNFAPLNLGPLSGWLVQASAP